LISIHLCLLDLGTGTNYYRHNFKQISSTGHLAGAPINIYTGQKGSNYKTWLIHKPLLQAQNPQMNNFH